LKPHVKTQNIPLNEYEKGVRIVVGDNFLDVVLKDDVDVLTFFYAPWCPHC
jgi:thiol-disulfide isomerase/thioredoxin